MPLSITTNWDASYTLSSINGTAIANAASATSTAIDNNNKVGTEVSVNVSYGSTATQGIVVAVLRVSDNTPTYESGTGDLPWSFMMPYAANTTFHRVFTIPGDRVSKFEIYILNNSGAGATVTVWYKQFTLQVG